MRERRERSRMTKKNKEITQWKTEQQDISTKMNWAREEKRDCYLNVKRKRETDERESSDKI